MTTSRWPAVYHNLVVAESADVLFQLAGVLGDVAAADEQSMNGLARRARQFSPMLAAYNHLRWLVNPASDNLYLDQPNVAFLHQRLGTGGATGASLLLEFDIVHNRVAVRPAIISTAFEQRLTQGIADTVAESVFSANYIVAANSARFFETLVPGEPWRLLEPGPDTGAVVAADLPPDAAFRVARDLSKGLAVLLPPDGSVTSGGSVLWWRIDPQTGTTLGVSATGMGQSSTEYAILQGWLINFNYCAWGAIGATAVKALIGGDVGSGFGTTATVAICAAVAAVPAAGTAMGTSEAAITHSGGVIGIIGGMLNEVLGGAIDG